MKRRFPKGFHRGMELFGQQAERLRKAGYREFIARHGIPVVEGFNDVIGLDNIGVPAVGIMSNRMTEMQGDKVTKWATQLAHGRVTLIFDCEPSGIRQRERGSLVLRPTHAGCAAGVDAVDARREVCREAAGDGDDWGMGRDS
jgi:hypothetical protein